MSTDHTKLDVELIHRYLNSSEWAAGISRQLVAQSIDGSLCFGLYTGATQIGFARIITDCATFAYLADVFVVDEYQKRGLGRWLMVCVMAHRPLQGLRRWLLATSTAPWLYEKIGWTALKRPEIFMELFDAEVYKRPSRQAP